MVALPWWIGTAAKTVLTTFLPAGAMIFWILSEMAHDPQAGGSVVVLLGITVLLGGLGLIGLFSLGSDLRHVMSE